MVKQLVAPVAHRRSIKHASQREARTLLARSRLVFTSFVPDKGEAGLGDSVGMRQDSGWASNLFE